MAEEAQRDFFKQIAEMRGSCVVKKANEVLESYDTSADCYHDLSS